MSKWEQAKAKAKVMTDIEMTAAIEEMRSRGYALAAYDGGEFATMFDGELKGGFDLDAFMGEHRESIEEAMCDTAREYFLREADEAFEVEL